MFGDGSPTASINADQTLTLLGTEASSESDNIGLFAQCTGEPFMLKTFGVLDSVGVPTAGLKLWVRADAGVSTLDANGGLAVWEDQSGNSNHFSQSNPDARPRLALPGSLGFQVSGYDLGADARVFGICRQLDGKVVIGGDFHSFEGVPREHIARLNADGTLDLDFNPGANSTVVAMAVSGSNLYVGGRFTEIGGVARSRFAKLRLSDGAVDTSFTADADEIVYTFQIVGDALYIGGHFTMIGGQAHERLARLNLNTDAIDAAFTLGADSYIYSLVEDGTHLYVGGQFSVLGGEARAALARLELSGGALDTAFAPAVGGSISDMTLLGTNLYIAGEFGWVNGQPRNNLACLDKAGGALSGTFTSDANWIVAALLLDGTDLYVGGYFTEIGGQPRNRLARLDALTGRVDPGFTNAANAWVQDVKDIVKIGAGLYLGGSFTFIDDVPARGFATLTEIFSEEFLPSVRFDPAGTPDFLTNSYVPSGPLTVIVRRKFEVFGDAEQALLSCQKEGTPDGGFLYKGTRDEVSRGRVTLQTGIGGAWVSGVNFTGAPVSTNWAVDTIRIAASRTELWVHDILSYDNHVPPESDVGGNAKGAIAPGLPLTLGENAVFLEGETAASRSAPLDGQVMELLIYDRALSDSEKQRVRDYLGEKFNEPPEADAGPDQFILMPTQTARLQGRATDDGYPAGLAGEGGTSCWTQISGPEGVAFSNAATPATEATFPALGIYTLRLTVGDGEFTVYDEVQVIIAQLAIEPFDGLFLNHAKTVAITVQPEGVITNLLLKLERLSGNSGWAFFESALGGEQLVAGSANVLLYGAETSSEPDNIRLSLSQNGTPLLHEDFSVVDVQVWPGNDVIYKGMETNVIFLVFPPEHGLTNLTVAIERESGETGRAIFGEWPALNWTGGTNYLTEHINSLAVLGEEASDAVGNMRYVAALDGVSWPLTNFTVAGLVLYQTESMGEPLKLLRKGQEVYMSVFSQPAGLDLGLIELSIALASGSGEARFMVQQDPMDPVLREATNILIQSGYHAIVRGKEASSEYGNMRLLAGLPPVAPGAMGDEPGPVWTEQAFTVVDVAISPLDFIWWGHTTNAAVDILPPDLVQGTNTLSLSLATVSGSGEAVFDDTSEAERDIVGSTNVVLRSDMYSSEQDNLRLSVMLNGQEFAATNFESILLELAAPFRAVSDSWPRNVYVMLSPETAAGDILCVLTNSLGGTGSTSSPSADSTSSPQAGSAVFGDNSISILLSDARALWGSQLPIAAETLSGEAGDMRLAFEVYGRPLLTTNFTVMHVEASPVNFLVKGSSTNVTLTVTPTPCGDNIQLRLAASVDGGGYFTNREYLAFSNPTGTPTRIVTGTTNLDIYAGMPAGTVYGFLDATLDDVYPVFPGVGFPVIGIELPFDKLCLGETRNLRVTVPTLQDTNQLVLNVATIGGTGLMTFAQSATNLVLTESADIPLSGVELSSELTNILFTAFYNGNLIFSKNMTVYEMRFGPIGVMAEGATTNLDVAFVPLSGEDVFTLHLSTVEGEGQAVFPVNGTASLEIVGATNIAIHAVQASTVAGNILLAADINGYTVYSTNFTIAKASLGDVGVVFVGQTNNVPVVVQPADLDVTVTLTLEKLSGGGSAVFEDPAGSGAGDSLTRQVSASSAVAVKGVAPSSETNNFRLKSEIGGLLMDAKTFTVAELECSPLAFLREGSSTNLQVLLKPEGLVPDAPVALSIETLAGTGSATFPDGLSALSVTSPASVVVTGVLACSELGNLRLKADLVFNEQLVLVPLADFTVMKAACSPLPGLRVAVTNSAEISVEPASLGANAVRLTLSTRSGTGRAAFDGGAGSLDIHGSETVSVHGEETSSEERNIELAGSIQGIPLFSTNLTVFDVDFGPIRYLREGRTTPIAVTFQPSAYGTNIVLTLATVAGSGLAVFGTNETSVIVSGDSEVAIKAKEASSQPENIRLTASADGQAYRSADFTVARVEFAPFNRILLNATQDVAVTLTPSPLGTNLELRISLLSGEGEALFPGPSNEYSTVRMQDVTAAAPIFGKTASTEPGNFLLTAVIGGDTFASTNFTVMGVACSPFDFMLEGTLKTIAVWANPPNVLTNGPIRLVLTNTVGAGAAHFVTNAIEYVPYWTNGAWLTQAVVQSYAVDSLDFSNNVSLTITAETASAVSGNIRLLATQGQTEYRVRDFSVIKLVASPLGRLLMNHTNSVAFTVTPADLDKDIELTLSAVSGRAEFEGGQLQQVVNPLSLYAPGSPYGEGNITIVTVEPCLNYSNITLTADIDGISCLTTNFTVIGASFGAVGYVFTDTGASVDIHILPPGSISVTLDISTLDGTGGATFTNGGTHLVVTNDAVVGLVTTNASSIVSNIQLSASGSGQLLGTNLTAVEVVLGAGPSNITGGAVGSFPLAITPSSASILIPASVAFISPDHDDCTRDGGAVEFEDIGVRQSGLVDGSMTHVDVRPVIGSGLFRLTVHTNREFSASVGEIGEYFNPISMEFSAAVPEGSSNNIVEVWGWNREVVLECGGGGEAEISPSNVTTICGEPFPVTLTAITRSQAMEDMWLRATAYPEKTYYFTIVAVESVPDTAVPIGTWATNMPFISAPPEATNTLYSYLNLFEFEPARFVSLGVTSLTVRCGTSEESGQITVVGVGSAQAEPDSVLAGESVTLTAHSDPAGHDDLLSWSGAGVPATNQGGAFTTRWEKAGFQYPSAHCGTMSRVVTVTVAGVVSLTATPDIVPQGTQPVLTAETFPAGNTNLITYVPPNVQEPGYWEAKAIWGSSTSVCTVCVAVVTSAWTETNLVSVRTTVTLNAQTYPEHKESVVKWYNGATLLGQGSPFNVSLTEAGVHPLKAVAGTSFADVVVTAVAVATNIECCYGTNGWKAMPDPLVVQRGTEVEFRVFPTPGGKWPLGKPKWGGVAAGIGSATDPIPFNEFSTNQEPFLITVECGNIVTGRVAVLRVDIAMDGNRDTNIVFGSTNDDHCLFWLNDDYDINHWEEGMWHEDDNKEESAYVRNCTDNSIGRRGENKYFSSPSADENNCLRDLEDFTVVQVKVPGIITNLTGITYWLKFENVQNGRPKANLFKAITNGVTTPFDYLTNSLVASNQVKETRAYTIDAADPTGTQVSTNYINRYDEPIGFLLEGYTEGKGDLTFIVKKDGSELCRSSVSLDLQPIANFYDTYKIGRIEERHWWSLWQNVKTKWEAEVDAMATHGQANTAYPVETDKYLLLVHGWNMSADDKRYFAQTAFKRLWWQGYKGGFGLFDWPTLYGFDPGLNVGTIATPRDTFHHYDNSDMIAWLSATALARLMENLNGSGQLRVWAHSMGNVVTGEALRKYAGVNKVKTYIATQAAISGRAYSQSAPATDFSSWTYTNYYGPQTPRLYDYWASGDAATTDQPYLATNPGKVDRMCNYYNALDYALDWWKVNNKQKPDDIAGYAFAYGGSTIFYNEASDPTNRFYRMEVPPKGLNILVETNLQDRYAVFAYDLESWSVALGAATNAAFSFNNLNLRDLLNYDNQHYSHSRQFRSNILDERKYYESLLHDGGF